MGMMFPTCGSSGAVQRKCGKSSRLLQRRKLALEPALEVCGLEVQDEPSES